jgi:hypothetical protein
MNNSRKLKPTSTRVSSSPTKGGGILIEVHVSVASVELTPQGCWGHATDVTYFEGLIGERVTMGKVRLEAKKLNGLAL